MQILWYIVWEQLLLCHYANLEFRTTMETSGNCFMEWLICCCVFSSVFYDRTHSSLLQEAKSLVQIWTLTFQPAEIIVKLPLFLLLARVVTKHNSEYNEHFCEADFFIVW